jgi:hypothetical protein
MKPANVSGVGTGRDEHSGQDVIIVLRHPESAP